MENYSQEFFQGQKKGTGYIFPEELFNSFSNEVKKYPNGLFPRIPPSGRMSCGGVVFFVALIPRSPLRSFRVNGCSRKSVLTPKSVKCVFTFIRPIRTAEKKAQKRRVIKTRKMTKAQTVEQIFQRGSIKKNCKKNLLHQKRPNFSDC